MKIDRSSNGKAAWERVANLVERNLPSFARMCARRDAEMILLHQDAFAADYQEDELTLLGAAIKYAGMHKKEVRIIPDQAA